eukprot:scaffold204054_cov14-Prasinocladus_malaysianus.AAC.1
MQTRATVSFETESKRKFVQYTRHLAVPIESFVQAWRREVTDRPTDSQTDRPTGRLTDLLTD